MDVAKLDIGSAAAVGLSGTKTLPETSFERHHEHAAAAAGGSDDARTLDGGQQRLIGGGGDVVFPAALNDLVEGLAADILRVAGADSTGPLSCRTAHGARTWGAGRALRSRHRGNCTSPADRT